MMTAAELIQQLSKADPKSLVTLSSDPEGNSFHRLREIEAYATAPKYTLFLDDIPDAKGHAIVVLWP